jgi:hypothetical protein
MPRPSAIACSVTAPRAMWSLRRGRSSDQVGDDAEASARFACLGGAGCRCAAAGRSTTGASATSCAIAARNTVVWRAGAVASSNRPRTRCNTAVSAASRRTARTWCSAAGDDIAAAHRTLAAIFGKRVVFQQPLKRNRARAGWRFTFSANAARTGGRRWAFCAWAWFRSRPGFARIRAS